MGLLSKILVEAVSSWVWCFEVSGELLLLLWGEDGVATFVSFIEAGMLLCRDICSLYGKLSCMVFSH